MAIQPTHHWQFSETRGTTVKDSVNGHSGKFYDTTFDKCGQLGDAVLLKGRGAHINLGEAIGQFGTSDFTIAFGMLILSNHGQTDLDIISNRNVMGHGNWFALRIQHGRALTFEVDENSKGKHYAAAKSAKLLVANKWFHIAIVRKGNSLKIYHNGIKVAEGNAADAGVANINSNVDVKLGHWKRHTPRARYEDLRIYDKALSDKQIESIAPALNPLLKTGEIELMAGDGSRRILDGNQSNLTRFSNAFTRLRVGPNTGVTLYDGNNFSGNKQKLFAGLPETRHTRLKGTPKSVHVWSSAGEPFRGEWIIRAPQGGYLHWNKGELQTTEKCSLRSLFKFNFNQNHGQLQLISHVDHEGSSISLDTAYSPMIVDDTEDDEGEFSIKHLSHTLWLSQNDKGIFEWTADESKRAIFVRVAKFAAHEDQVGELATGEVALYEHLAYHGKAWILSNNGDELAGNFTSLQDFFGLNNVSSSIRLGPNTGVTLFANNEQKVRDGKRETDIEDITVNTPSLFESQIGNDNLSSLKIFTKVPALSVFSSITSKLSQDYRMLNGKLEEFSAYRTILTLEPDVSEVEVSATDLTTIEVEDETYEIDELRSVTLKPNLLNKIMITSEADGLHTPMLKFRTADMAENERILVSPADELHQQIANLEQDAIYDGKDANGQAIVDHNKHTRSEVASAQNTIKRVISSIQPADSIATEKPVQSVANNVRTQNTTRALASNKLSLAEAKNQQPWSLNFRPNSTSAKVPAGATARSVLQNKEAIWEQSVSQAQFDALINANTQVDAAQLTNATSLQSGFQPLQSRASLRIGRRFFRGIGDALKNATKVTFGFVKNVLNAFVEVAGQIVKFVLDTIEVVAEFVQAVVEKVVKSIKQFIEFLRFLFNWEDILKTQRFMVKSVNNAFDSAAEFVAAAKQPVSNTVNHLQDKVEDGIDNLIRSLGVDPTEDPAGSGLPEAAEWFLNKFIGGSKSSDNDKTLTSSSDTTLTAGSSLQQGFQHLLQALKEAALVGVEIADGVIDTIETFISNPTRPELALVAILDTIKDVGVGILEVGEQIMLGLLDIVVGVIKLFQDILNKEIRIPLISNLFELIGAGKLTVLNVITLLIAIPTTVMSKLIFGERPFKEIDAPTIVEQKNTALTSNLTTQRAALVQAPVSKQESTSDNDDARTRNLVKGFGVLSLTADLTNGIITAGLDANSEATDDDGKGTFIFEASSLLLSWISWLGSFPSSPDKVGGYPYALAKHKINNQDNPREFNERLMWGWRTAVLGFDTVFFMSSLKDAEIPEQRMKRADEFSTFLTTCFAIIDLQLTAMHLSEIPKEDKRGREVANEVISILPNIFGALRHSGPKGAIALGILSGVCAITNYGLGIAILRDDVKEI